MRTVAAEHISVQWPMHRRPGGQASSGCECDLSLRFVDLQQTATETAPDVNYAVT